MNTNTEFNLVDDDPVNNMLSEIAIEEVFPDAIITSFTNPKEGLNYILTAFNHPNSSKSILFLDLNMPIMNGWEFLEQFEKADSSVKEQLMIYILSSSVDPSDLEKAKLNPRIKDFIEKPLSEEVLISIAAG